MIIRIGEDVTRLGVRLLSAKHRSYVADWRHVKLTIMHGQLDSVCGPNGSPWILHGCWYGLPTEVDLANPPMPDFPAITVPAEGTGDDCELIFILPPRFKDLPFGRYTGLLHYDHDIRQNPCDVTQTSKKKKKAVKRWPLEAIPLPYHINVCSPEFIPPEPPALAPKMCVLAEFDIDYGQRCGEHIIDHATVTCGKVWCDADECA